MNSTKLICHLFLFITLSISNAHAQPTIKVSDKTATYLSKFRVDYAKSILGKIELLENYLSENIRLMPEFQKTILGKANALAYYKAFSSRFIVTDYRRNEMEILDLGTRVIEIGNFIEKIKLKNGDKEFNIEGKYLSLWERLENGNLTLITEAWNYNHQLDIEPLLKFEEIKGVDIALQSHLPIDSPVRFELAALNELMEATVSQHDSKLWKQFYTDDGMFLYSRNPIYQGRKSIDKFLEEHTKDLPIFEKLDIRNDRIDELSNFVIEYASHIAVIRNGEFSGVFTGKDLAIWRRGSQGSLKIFRHIAMYD
jgi:ketosteroid isomerase-like protein